MMLKHCIIGGGPVGLTLASFFQKFKIPFILIEKSENLSSHPSAHYINLRSREVFNEIPNINQEIDIAAEPLENVRNYTYLRRIGEQPFIETDHFAPSIQDKLDQLKKYSFASPSHLPQNLLVKVLYEQLDHKNILTGLEVDQIQTDQQGYIVTAKNSQGQVQTFKPQYIYGCDGLNGIVRKYVNIPLLGQPNIQTFLNVHFESRILAELVLKNKSMLTFVYNSDIVAVLIAHQIKTGMFAIQIPLDVLIQPSQKSGKYTFDKEEIAKITNQQVIRLIQSMVTKENNLRDISVKSIGVWKMGAVVAESYYKDGIVLVGDAAHALPPAGGFGMNTGIQDAHNLAHKIKSLENETKDEVKYIFQEYQNERQKVANENIQTSLKYYQKSIEVAKAIGFDQKNLQLFQGVYGSISSLLNPNLSQTIYSKFITLGSSLIETQFFSSRARTQLSKIYEKGENLIPLILPQEEVGFQYHIPSQQNKDDQLIGKLIPNYSINNDALGLRHYVQQQSQDCWIALTFNTNKQDQIRDIIMKIVIPKLSSKSHIQKMKIIEARLVDDEQKNLINKIIIIRSDQHIYGIYDL